MRQAFSEVRDEFHQAFNGDDNLWSGPVPPPELEEADGLPVPIVPGSRVTVAQTKPPAPAVPPARPAPTPTAGCSQSPLRRLDAGCHA